MQQVGQFNVRAVPLEELGHGVAPAAAAGLAHDRKRGGADVR